MNNSRKTGITSYTSDMKTAISLPDDEFERFERVAERHGLSRSAFYRAAGAHYADQLEDASNLTRLANEALRANPTSDTDDFIRTAERIISESSEW